MTPQARIYVQFDETNLETGWDETGQSWHVLHFSGDTVREHEGGFPSDYRLDLSLSDTPGYIEVPWIKGDFGGVVFFYPDDDPDSDSDSDESSESDVADLVSTASKTNLFTDCLRLSSRLIATGVPLVANITSTRIEGGRKGERVLAFSLADRGHGG